MLSRHSKTYIQLQIIQSLLVDVYNILYIDCYYLSISHTKILEAGLDSVQKLIENIEFFLVQVKKYQENKNQNKQ